MSEILLSNLLRFSVVEAGAPEQRPALRFYDLALGPLDTDYPQVSCLLLRGTLPQGGPAGKRDTTRRELQKSYGLPWEAVKWIDWKRKRVLVSSLQDALEMDEEALAKELLLRRDVLDAFIIDLQNRRVTRSNDLLLESNDHLCLNAVDTGVHALLRRLSWGLYQGRKAENLQNWKYVEFLRGDPAAVISGRHYHRRIIHLAPGEIANLAERLPYLHAAELILLIPAKLAGDALEVMTVERQLQVFEELDERQALQVLENMSPDLAADLVGRLSPEHAKHLLEKLPQTEGERIIELLRYPENTVGGIMTNDILAAPGSLTVAEARESLREHLSGPDFVYFIYVVDNLENRALRGVVSLRNYLIAGDDQLLEEIMNPYLVTLSPLDSPGVAAYRLINSQLAALPVIGDEGRLLGALTVDAAVSQVAPASWSFQHPRVFS